MKFYEILIIIIAILLVFGPIISYFIKKKKGTLKCECGHLRSQCVGNCTTCNNLDDLNKKKFNKYIIHFENITDEEFIDNLIKKNFKTKYIKTLTNKSLTVITSEKELDIDLIKKILLDSNLSVTTIDKL